MKKMISGLMATTMILGAGVTSFASDFDKRTEFVHQYDFGAASDLRYQFATPTTSTEDPIFLNKSRGYVETAYDQIVRVNKDVAFSRPSNINFYGNGVFPTNRTNTYVLMAESMIPINIQAHDTNPKYDTLKTGVNNKDSWDGQLNQNYPTKMTTGTTQINGQAYQYSGSNGGTTYTIVNSPAEFLTPSN